jgi:hypothetical protein
VLLAAEVSDDELVVELAEDVLPDDDEVNCEIRLCRLAASFPGPPTALAESDDPLALDELPCDCKADIRLCKKLPIACAALDVLDVELVESELVELVELLEVPLLLESLVPVTPICDKASAMAPIRPPPPPGGGGVLPTALLELLLPDCVLHPICDVK